MTTHQLLTLGVALSITILLASLFANHGTLAWVFEPQTAVAVPGTGPVTPSSGEPMGHLDPSRSEKAL